MGCPAWYARSVIPPTVRYCTTQYDTRLIIPWNTGSTSLIFNFIFAYLLVGTPVTHLDIIGTLTIVIGVIGVVIFGSKRQNGTFDTESNLTLELLQRLWSRTEWIIFIVLLELGVGGMYWVSGIVEEVRVGKMEDDRGELEDRGIEGMTGGRRYTLSPTPSLLERAKYYLSRLRRIIAKFRQTIKSLLEGWAQSSSDIAVRKLAGLSYALTGGMYAGITLILAKSFVKLISTSWNGENMWTSPLSWLIVLLLLTAAFAQICTSHFLLSIVSTWNDER